MRGRLELRLDGFQHRLNGVMLVGVVMRVFEDKGMELEHKGRSATRQINLQYWCTSLKSQSTTRSIMPGCRKKVVWRYEQVNGRYRTWEYSLRHCGARSRGNALQFIFRKAYLASHLLRSHFWYLVRSHFWYPFKFHLSPSHLHGKLFFVFNALPVLCTFRTFI